MLDLYTFEYKRNLQKQLVNDDFMMYKIKKYYEGLPSSLGIGFRLNGLNGLKFSLCWK